MDHYAKACELLQKAENLTDSSIDPNKYIRLAEIHLHLHALKQGRDPKSLLDNIDKPTYE